MAPLLKKEDGLIDWTLTAGEIANRVRGLSPWPGAYTYVNGERWTLWRVAVGDESQRMDPGIVTKVTKDRVDVATGGGTIQILEIQPSNSRRMTMAQYLAGHRLNEGLVLQAGPSAQA
jgi:methionyl-tRNA formyltransferase